MRDVVEDAQSVRRATVLHLDASALAGHRACTPTRVLEGILAGVLLGLSSAPHCIAMCGPLVAFAAVDQKRVVSPSAVLRYQAGRVVGYAVVGTIAGVLGRGITAFLPFEAEAIFSVTLAVTLALAAFRFWPRESLVRLGVRPRTAGLRTRLSTAVAAWLGRLPKQPLLLGAASALLPCGVLASGALLAAGSGGAISGASVMVGLAFGSGVALIVGSMVLGRVDLSKSRHAAMALSIVLALGALALASRPLLVASNGAACHAG